MAAVPTAATEPVLLDWVALLAEDARDRPPESVRPADAGGVGHLRYKPPGKGHAALRPLRSCRGRSPLATRLSPTQIHRSHADRGFADRRWSAAAAGEGQRSHVPGRPHRCDG